MERYIEAEQEPPDDNYSFPVLGPLRRNIEIVEEAASKLNLDSDKIHVALFWFWNGNPITDEVAFEALKEGNVEEAFQIWNKLTSETKGNGNRAWKTVSEKNCSAFHNYFVLEMLRADGNINTAIEANLYFLESNLLQKFISAVADSTYKTTAKVLQINFLNEILKAIDKKNVNLSRNQFVEIINKVNFSAKSDFLKNAAQKFVNNISAKIETSRKRRIDNAANAIKTGEELYQQTKNDLEQLMVVVGLKDFAYSNIADKLSKEILQCGIDYFNYNQNINASINYCTPAINLAKIAEKIAVGAVAQEWIQANTTTMEEMNFKAIQDLKVVEQEYNKLAWNQTINEDAVVDFIQKSITQQYVNLIKNSDNQIKKYEYRILVNFVMEHLSYVQKKRIKYLAYWDTTSISKPTTSASKSNNAGCWLAVVIAVLITVVGALTGLGSGDGIRDGIVGGFVGLMAGAGVGLIVYGQMD